MENQLHISELIARKIRGELDQKGEEQLEHWLEEDPAHREILDRAANRGSQFEKLQVYSLFDKEKMKDQLEENLFGTRTRRLDTRTLLRYAASIVLPLLILGGVSWWFLGRTGNDMMAEIDSHIQPGNQQAVLVLSDGSRVELDPSVAMDAIVEGNATIRSADHGIHYTSETDEPVSSRAIYNELITPRGGNYVLTLADGSRVWLNAGSSMHFPVSFTDTVRHVSLKGEAYFEVRPDARPFIVSSGDLQTRVLGTSFNISAYGDDPFIRTTLVEGKVMVTLTGEDAPEERAVILEPDQQVSYLQEERSLRVDQVDAGSYVSWVDGKLEFYHEDLEQVLKQLSRWYDFTYEFENEKARELSFSARLDRDSQISEILDMLALTTDVSFEYRGKSIVVH